MELEIKRKELFEGVNIAQAISEKKSVVPILSYMLISAQGDSVQISATDLEVFVKLKIPCSVRKEGEISVVSRKLYEILREMEFYSLKLSVQKYKISINSGSVVCEIVSLPSSEFPKVDDSGFSKIFTISSQDLRDLLDKTTFAAAPPEESRYALTGILIEVERGKVNFVASDGHRLSLCGKEIKTDAQKTFLISKSSADEIRKVVSVDNVDFEIFISSKASLFTCKNVSVWVKFLDEEFPKYKDVIPQDFKTKIVVKTPELKRVVRRASVFSSSKFSVVKLDVKKGTLKVSAESPEFGRSEESVDADISGQDIQIHMSTKYLLDSVSAIDAPLVSIKISGDMSPCVVEPSGGFGATGVIMPVRL